MLHLIAIAALVNVAYGSCVPDSNGDITISTNESCSTVSLSARNLVIAGSLELGPGATVRCYSLLAVNGSRLVIAEAVNVTVAFDAVFQKGSFVDGLARGYAEGVGPGAGSPMSAHHAGCSGRGLCDVSFRTSFSNAAAASAYGDFIAPSSPGSGGYGAAGGAALLLSVSGALSLNGTINVNGGNGATGYGSGSGGSIFIRCSTLAASLGALSADGGSGTIGASAGRIAIVCSRHSFRTDAFAAVSLAFSAAGGASTADGYTAGAPGTVWLQLGGPRPFLLVRGRGAGGAAQPSFIMWPNTVQPALSLAGAEIVLERGATLQFPRDTPYGQYSPTPNVSIGLLTGDGSGGLVEVTDATWLQASNVTAPASALVIKGAGLSFLAGSGRQLPADIVLGSGGALKYTGALQVNSLTVERGGLLEILSAGGLSCNSLLALNGSRIAVAGQSLITVTGNAVLASGSVLDGVSRGIQLRNSGTAHAGCAAGGGCAANLAAAQQPNWWWYPVSIAYDELHAPLVQGVGGEIAGGAAVRLAVSGSLTLNASVDVSGGGGGLSGSAGGSIYITCGTLAHSSGSLAAHGGWGYFGGSAGRIAVVCSRHSYRSGVLSLSDVALSAAALGGLSSAPGGERAGNYVPPPFGRGAVGTTWFDFGRHVATDALSQVILLVRGSNEAAEPALAAWPSSQPLLNLTNVQIVLERSAVLRFVKDASWPAAAVVAAICSPPLGDGSGTVEVGSQVALQLVQPGSGGAGGNPSAQQLDIRGFGLRFLAGSSPALPRSVIVGESGKLAAVGTMQLNISALVVQNGGMVELASAANLSLHSLLMRNGSRLTFGGLSAATVAVAGDAAIEVGARMDGVGLGFPLRRGPGFHPNGFYTWEVAGAHSGCSAFGSCGASLAAGLSTAPANVVYGSFDAPMLPGSGGYGAAGGGALRLSVAGALTFNGTVDASGQAALDEWCGGGAGGSIYITCGTLEPSLGSLIVDGGRGVRGGSAGRAALVCSRYSGLPATTWREIGIRFSGLGGASTPYFPEPRGGLGTFWLSVGTHASTGAQLQPPHVLLVRGSGSTPSDDPAAVLWPGPQEHPQLSLAALALENGASVRMVRDAALASANLTLNASLAALSGDGGTSLELGDAVFFKLQPPAGANVASIRGLSLRFLAGSNALLPRTVIIADKGTIAIANSQLNANATDVVVVAGGSVQLSSATLTCSSFTARNGSSVAVSMSGAISSLGDATFEAGSTVDGAGSGFANGAGPGSATWYAAHAGCGAGSDVCSVSLPAGMQDTPANVAHGDFRWPIRPGSGGDYGPGGAAFQLYAPGTLVLNGTIDMSSLPSQGFGGAGGSIAISCGTLGVSAGKLSVDGSRYSSAGRIAVLCDRHWYNGSTIAEVLLSFSAASRLNAVLRGYGAPGTTFLSLGRSAVASPANNAALAALVVRGGPLPLVHASLPAFVIIPASESQLSLAGVQMVVDDGAQLRIIRDSSSWRSGISGSVAGLNGSTVVTLSPPNGDGTGTLFVSQGINASVADASFAAAAGASLGGNSTGGTMQLRNASFVFLPGSTLVLPPMATISDGGLLSLSSGMDISASVFTVDAGGAVLIEGNFSLRCQTLQLRGGSRTVLSRNATATLVAEGSAIIELGAVIDGVGGGFAASQGPGASALGAAHAGCSGAGGCNASVSGVVPGAAYGDMTAPVMAGSGGSSGAGGAALRFRASGTLTLNGTIDVSAAPTGGGSGGSVFVECGTLLPSSASLIANGSDDSGYGGSAGRIAIVCSRHSFPSPASGVASATFNITAQGGRSGLLNAADGAPGTVFVSFASSVSGPLGRIRALIAAAPASASRAAQSPVALAAAAAPGGSAVVQLDELRLDGGASLAVARPEPLDGAVLVSSASLTTIGARNATPSIGVGAAATLLLFGQELVSGNSSVRARLMPSGVTVSSGPERITAVLSAASDLASAQVLLSEPGCSTPSNCTTFIGAVRLTGTALSFLCRTGYLTQRWTAAQSLGVTVCSDTQIVSRYDFSTDPGPWLYYNASIALTAAAADSASGSASGPTTNAVVVRLAGPPPAVAAPATAAWSEIITLRAPGVAVLLGSAAARVTVQADGSAPLPVSVLPAMSTFDANAVNISFRFVSSAWQARPTVALGGRLAWAVRLAAAFTRPQGRVDFGTVFYHTLSASFMIPVVKAVQVRLPALLPRNESTLAAGSVVLPAPVWSAAEIVGICPSDACAIAVGAFLLPQTSCGNGNSLPALRIPAGYGADRPVSVSFCGGLLNISLGQASYVPSAVASIWPPLFALQPAAAVPRVRFYLALADAIDAPWFTTFTVADSVLCTAAQPVSLWSLPAGAPAAVASAFAVATANGGCVLKCDALTAELSEAVGANDTATLPFSLLWGGTPLALPGATKALSGLAKDPLARRCSSDCGA